MEIFLPQVMALSMLIKYKVKGNHAYLGCVLTKGCKGTSKLDI